MLSSERQTVADPESRDVFALVWSPQSPAEPRVISCEFTEALTRTSI